MEMHMNTLQKSYKRNNNHTNNDNYIDFGSVGKGLIFLGVILLFIYFVLYIFTITVPENSIWDDAFLGVNNIFTATTIPAIILLFIGGLLYFFHIQFVKLGEFAAEVESGEFERELAEKSKGKSVDTRGQGSGVRD
jgi:hypothetical protein